MANKDAVKQVIELKKQYDQLSKKDANFHKSDQARQLSQQAEQIRRSNNIDENRYGSGATLAQAYTNYAKDFGTNNNSNSKNKVKEASYEELNQRPQGYDREILELLKSLPSQVMDYDDAKKMANEQLGTTYDQALDQAMKQIDRQSLQNGFFGQLPTVDYKQRNADNIQAQRSQAISQLANQLVSESKADVQNKINSLSSFSNNLFEKAFKERDYQDSRNDVDWEKLFKEKQYQDSRSDADWQKGITEAQLTGVFQGQPTMALTQLAHNMDMDTKKMEQAEKQLNHQIEMSWENLKNDRVSLGQAAARIGLQREAQNMDYTKFMAGIKQTAFDMTMQTLAKSGMASYDDDMGWLTGGEGSTSSSVETGDIMDLMDIYTQVLLGEIDSDDLFGLEQSWLSNNGGSSYDGRTK